MVWNSEKIPGNISKLILVINSPKNPWTWWPSPKNFSGNPGEVFWRNSEEFCGEKFLGISPEFLETESQNCDPTKISHLVGTNSGEFLKNFWGISYRKLFSRNSLEILQKKSSWLENLGINPHFCYLGLYTFALILITFKVRISLYHDVSLSLSNLYLDLWDPNLTSLVYWLIFHLEKLYIEYTARGKI